LLILALPDPVSQWNVEKVGNWIEGLSKEKGIGNADALKQNFMRNKIDGKKLLGLKSEHFTALGITLVGDVMEVEEAISNLKQGIFHIQNSHF
jgi:hypothetical protein